MALELIIYSNFNQFKKLINKLMKLQTFEKYK